MKFNGITIRQMKQLAKLRTRVDKTRKHSQHLDDISREYTGFNWNTVAALYKKENPDAIRK